MYFITVEPPRLIAFYEYDPWGKVTSVKGSSGAILSLEAYPNHIAHVNPIRYRGYYYDIETGFYYLQSRYYDPAISRFINADSYGSTGQGFLGTNMFAYCGNNPVDRVDRNGEFWQKAEEFSKQANKYSYPVEFLLECTTLGSTLQYKVTYTKKGGMYEHWYVENGVEIWTRHHSDHGNPTKHPIVPHDHEWFDDKDGNHKPGPGQKPNPAFQAPNEEKNNTNKFAIATGAIGGAAIGYGVYVIAKWAVAIFAAPATGGTSIAIAGATP